MSLDENVLPSRLVNDKWFGLYWNDIYVDTKLPIPSFGMVHLPL